MISVNQYYVAVHTLRNYNINNNDLVEIGATCSLVVSATSVGDTGFLSGGQTCQCSRYSVCGDKN